MPTAIPTTSQSFFADFNPWKLLEAPLVYEALKTLLKISTFPSCQFNNAMALASLAELNGQHAEALREINRALKLDPHNPDVHLQRGVIHFSLGRHQDALLSFARVIELNPHCAAAWELHGIILQSLGRHAGAVASLSQALRLQPAEAVTLSSYGAALYGLQRFEEARVALERGLALGHEDKTIMTALHCNHGLALAQLQQYERALSSFACALALEPKHFEAWCGKTETLFRLGRYNEVLSAAAHAMSHRPNDPVMRRHRGVALYNLGRYTEALEVSESLLNDDNQAAIDWTNRGLALAKLAQLSTAEESCRRAVELEAEEPTYWLNYGFTLDTLGRHAEACTAYQQALILAPEYRLAWNNLGMSHLHLFRQALQQRELSLAETHWREALRDGRRGQAHDWPEEEFNFLHTAAQLGYHTFALQLLQEAGENLLLLPLQHALDYLLTRDLNKVQTLPQELRRQTEKIISQL